MQNYITNCLEIVIVLLYDNQYLEERAHAHER